jgi:hypothetical protein
MITSLLGSFLVMKSCGDERHAAEHAEALAPGDLSVSEDGRIERHDLVAAVGGAIAQVLEQAFHHVGRSCATVRLVHGRVGHRALLVESGRCITPVFEYG